MEIALFGVMISIRLGNLNITILIAVINNIKSNKYK